MLNLGKSRLLRRSDVRRRLTDRRAPWALRIRSALGWSTLIALGFIVGAAVLVVSGHERFPYTLNGDLDRPVYSRVAFTRTNLSKTDELRKVRQQKVPDSYRLNRPLVDRISGQFLALHAAVKAADSFERFQETGAENAQLDQEAFDTLKSLTDDAGSTRFKAGVDMLASRLTQANMIGAPQTDRPVQSLTPDIEIDRGTGWFERVPRVKLIYATNRDHVKELAERLVAKGFPRASRAALQRIVENAISPTGTEEFEPVFVFDREYTNTQIEAAATVDPVEDAFKPGDVLVTPGTAGTISSADLALLRAEHDDYVRQRSTDPKLRDNWRTKRLGLIGAVLLLTLGLVVFTRREQIRIVQNPARATAFALLMLLMLVLNRFIVEIGGSIMWCVGTVTITAAVLTITYSQRFAAGATMLFTLLAVLALGGSINLLLVLLTVAFVVILLLSEIRTRFKLVQVGAVTAIAAGLSGLIVGLIGQQQLRTAFGDAFYAFLAAFAGTCVILVLLPIIERAFGIATSLTLLEWADTSDPLLKQLIQKAPGTWQHSHLLGSMAESAAEELGANGLLVRVGAYYHDIGKLCKPQYFIENQQANMNAHDGLAPTMSLLVILAHIKDGLALAREYGLPPVLHQFIGEHHGTTVVRYFHARAAQGAKPTGKHDREVSEAEFRYPGPKPRTKESVILMLCDSVEGAVRALQDPTPGRIEGKVHEIVMARLMDGQVDDCDITLKELASVEQSIVKSLCAIHHGRIAYPKSDSHKPALQVARIA